MKKINLICLLTLITSASYSQHRFILGIGKSQNTIKTGELNSFASTFNEYHQGNGFIPLSDFKPKMQPLNFSGGYRYMKNNGFSLGMIYMYSKDQQDNSTTLISKTGYDFHYSAKNHDFMFEIGYNIGGVITINGLGSLGIRNNTMQIWKVYANGNRSFGYENDLPGHYQTLTTHLDVGGSVGLKLWHFYIPLRVTYGMPIFSDGSSGFIDYDTQRFRSNELPKDYIKWATKPMEYDSKNIISQNEFTGMRIHLGIEFMIPLGK